MLLFHVICLLQLINLFWRLCDNYIFLTFHTKNKGLNKYLQVLYLIFYFNYLLLLTVELYFSLSYYNLLITHALTRWALWIIPKSHYMVYVGQHDFRIKTLNKGNTYLSSMRSVSYLRCCWTCAYIQEVTRSKSRYKHYASDSSFSFSTHVNKDKRSFIHS